MNYLMSSIIHDYPEHILHEAIRKISSTTHNETFSTKFYHALNRTKLIPTFHPNILAASRILQHHLNILRSDQDLNMSSVKNP